MSGCGSGHLEHHNGLEAHEPLMIALAAEHSSHHDTKWPNVCWKTCPRRHHTHQKHERWDRTAAPSFSRTLPTTVRCLRARLALPYDQRGDNMLLHILDYDWRHVVDGVCDEEAEAELCCMAFSEPQGDAFLESMSGLCTFHRASNPESTADMKTLCQLRFVKRFTKRRKWFEHYWYRKGAGRK